MSISQIANMNILRNLQNSTNSYQKTMDQLSSGSKYTSLGANPVAVSEATNLQIQINFNTRFQSNAALGSDMLTTTSEYQENILSNIQRIKDLSIQAASETFTGDDKNAIFSEIKSRLDYINTLSGTANFNGTNLLDGSAQNLSLRIGPNASDSIKIDSLLINCSTSALGINISATSGETWDTTSIQNYITKLDAASTILTSNSAKLGSVINRLDTVSDNLTNQTVNLTNYKSEIIDTDTAEASADLVRYQILQEVSSSIFLQTNDMNKRKTSLFVGSS